MSSTAVLRQVGDEVKTLLETEFDVDPNFPLAKVLKVSPNAPEEAQPQGRVVLWNLYEVRESEFLRNRPGQPVGNRPIVMRPPSLGLDLFYLMTPFTGSTENDLLALGKAMQVLHDNPVILVQTRAEGVAEELRISLLPLEFDDKARVWEGYRLKYRLSAYYQVRAVRIDGQRTEVDAPVRGVQLGGGG